MCPLGMNFKFLVIGIAGVLFVFSAHSETRLNNRNCPHVVVLDKRDSNQVYFKYDSRIENPGEAQIRFLNKALDRFTPILCQAVRRVVFIKLSDKPTVGGWSMSNDRQDLVYLSSYRTQSWNEPKIAGSPSAQAKANQKFVHESSHAAIRLLQSRQKSSPLGMLQGRPDSNLWTVTAGNMAKAIIQRLRLEKGVLREWLRLHEAFQGFGYAGAYYGEDWAKNSTAAVDHVKNGFASAYGGEDPMEDIAELVGWAIAGDLFTAGARRELKGEACITLGVHDKTGVPSRFAAVYTKLRFLQSMGVKRSSALFRKRICASPGSQRG